MTISWLWRRLAPCFLLTAIGIFVSAGPAAAEAVPERFTSTETDTGTDVSLCTGLTGFITHTSTEVGQVFDTGRTFHIVGVLTQDYRIDWSDGTYLISHSPTHFEFNTNSEEFVYTEAQQDRGTLYSADGQVIGTQTVIGGYHITWRDLNGNSQLEPGELTVSTDHGHVRCS